MTNELREIILAKMLADPRELTADQLASIEDDPELRELYALAVAVAETTASMPEMDIDAGWAVLKPRLAPHPKKRFNLQARLIGAVAAIALLIAVGAPLVLKPELPSAADIAKSTPPAEPQPLELSIAEIKRSPAATSPGNQTPVAKYVPVNPKREVIQETPAPEADEQHEADEIDPEELIWIEEARLENEVALAIAEVYRAELQNQLDIAAAMIDSGLTVDDNLFQQQLQHLNFDTYILP